MAKITVRKGMPSVQLDKAGIQAAISRRGSTIPTTSRSCPSSTRSSTPPGSPTTNITRARARGKPARASPIPDFDLPVEWLETRANVQRRRAQTEESEIALAHSDRQRLLAQRPDLPGRNVEDLAHGDAGQAGDREDARLRGRYPRSVAAHRRIRQGDLSRARPASPPRSRSATGRAAAIPTTRSARPATGWPRSIRNGWRRTA